MRWPFLRFIVLALGGIVPLLSFFMEARVAREVRTYLAEREASELHPPRRASTLTPEPDGGHALTDADRDRASAPSWSSTSARSTRS